MTVEASSIAKGKCYVTSSGQVRRVMEVEDGKITYESRGKKSVGKDVIWGPKATVPADQFADRVDREVQWDYDPNYDPKEG
ncbi:hypothetical protein [Pseudorhodoplanes sp.]|uniref:hypothetical protein n=1 Tax=Pseudorhodoplanes sp. TaxID=1934341 RepID=UPI003D0A69F8